MMNHFVVMTFVSLLRYEHMDPEIGIVMEQPNNASGDIYPFHKVEDDETGEMGSCRHYKTRKDISDKVRGLELNEVEEQ